jgi:PhoH-like ATPase
MPKKTAAEQRIIYVLDTNILVSFPGIVPGFSDRAEDKDEDLVAGHHLVIPNAVLRELDTFKNEQGNERGYSSRLVARQLRKLLGGYEPNDELCYNFNYPISLNDKADTKLSLLSVSDYRKSGAFMPSQTDMDGQIILTALRIKELTSGRGSEVILITNDNNMANRAWTKGIKTIEYGYKLPEPYKGRRTVEVPFDLMHQWDKNNILSLEDWQAYCPNEPPLVANEFVVFNCGEWVEWRRDYYFIARFNSVHSSGPSLVPLKFAHDLPFKIQPRSEGQAMMAELMMLPASEVPTVIIRGDRGTGKTFFSIATGLYQCQKNTYEQIFIVPPDPTLGEEKGFLPGDLDEKLAPEIKAIFDSLRSILKLKGYPMSGKSAKWREDEQNGKHRNDEDGEASAYRRVLDDRARRQFDEYFEVTALRYARGMNLDSQYFIIDEAQDLDRIQIETLLGRPAKNTKIVITGDPYQIHGKKYLNPYYNGLTYASNLLFDSPLVGQVTLPESEIERSEFVRFYADRLKKRQQNGE